MTRERGQYECRFFWHDRQRFKVDVSSVLLKNQAAVIFFLLWSLQTSVADMIHQMPLLCLIMSVLSKVKNFLRLSRYSRFYALDILVPLMNDSTSVYKLHLVFKQFGNSGFFIGISQKLPILKHTTSIITLISFTAK